MTLWHSASGRLVSGLAVGATLAITIGFAFSSVTWADGPDVRITELDCNGDPELVVIANLGDASQELDGWQIQSDPPETQTFDLIRLGPQLSPGEFKSIESGPAADLAPSTWADAFIFRDNDFTDYARLVDGAGNVVQQVTCSAVLEQVIEPSLAGAIPNGGGSPMAAGAAISPILITLLGGSLLSSGVTAFALSWLSSRRPRLQESESREAVSIAWAKWAPILRRATPARTRGSLRLRSGFVIVATSATIALLLLSRAEGIRRR